MNQSTKTKFGPYKDCYSRNNKNYDWLSFCDVDGFLELNIKYKTIKNILSDIIFQHRKNTLFSCL